MSDLLVWDWRIHRFERYFPIDARTHLFETVAGTPARVGQWLPGLQPEQLTEVYHDCPYDKQLIPKFHIEELLLSYYERGYIDGVFNYRTDWNEFLWRSPPHSIGKDLKEQRNRYRRDYLQGFRDGRGDTLMMEEKEKIKWLISQ